MESKNLLTLVITLTVGIILAGSLLMPVISDALDGEQDTFTNGTNYVKYVDEDCTLVLNANGVTMDDDALSTPAGFYFYSEDMIAYVGNPSPVVLGYLGQSNNTGITGEMEYTITIANDEATINDGTDDIATVPCKGIFVGSDTATDKIIRRGPGGNYFNNTNEILAAHSIGANFYSFHDSKLFVNGEEKTYTINSGYSAVEGYNDLYQSNDSFTFGYDNSTIKFTNAYIWDATVQGTIEGSEVSGVEASLYLAIPTLIIIALVLAAVPIIRKD